jgi:hypothetical protein
VSRLRTVRTNIGAPPTRIRDRIGGRDAAHTLYTFSMWENPSEEDTHITWTCELMEAMGPFVTPGVSLNFTSDQGQERVKDFFG